MKRSLLVSLLVVFLMLGGIVSMPSIVARAQCGPNLDQPCPPGEKTKKPTQVQPTSAPPATPTSAPTVTPTSPPFASPFVAVPQPPAPGSGIVPPEGGGSVPTLPNAPTAPLSPWVFGLGGIFLGLLIGLLLPFRLGVIVQGGRTAGSPGGVDGVIVQGGRTAGNPGGVDGVIVQGGRTAGMPVGIEPSVNPGPPGTPGVLDAREAALGKGVPGGGDTNPLGKGTPGGGDTGPT